MNPRNRIPQALKHGAYSATAVLPGESRADFEKLHRQLIAELKPSGVLEEDIVAEMARLIWRKQNLSTFRFAEFAEKRRRQIITQNVDGAIDNSPSFIRLVPINGLDQQAAQLRAAEEHAQNELGILYDLIDGGDGATLRGLTKELEIQERLGAAVSRCLKQLLLARGLKSLSAPASSSAKRISKAS